MQQPMILSREFSQLGTYQSRHSIAYILKTDTPAPCLSLCREQDGLCRTESVFLEKTSPEQARELLRFLYENAVPIENWKDVLLELIS